MKRQLLGFLVALCALPVYAQTVLFQEPVDTTGAFPVGWLARRWTTTDQTPSPGSGGFSFALQGRQLDRLCTPVFDARAATPDTLSYLARRTGSYPALHLVVRASVDGGHTFPYVVAAAGEALPEADGSWTTLRFPLPSELSGTPALQLCFDALGGTSTGARVQLDDITLQGTGQLRRWPLAAWPAHIDAGFVAVGDTMSLPLQVRNQTDSTLIVTLPAPPSPWWLSRSAVILPPRQTDTLTLFVAPTLADTFAVTWGIPLEGDTFPVSLHVTSTPPLHALGWHTPTIAARAQDTVQLGLQLQLSGEATVLQGLLVTALLPAHRLTYLETLPGASLPNPTQWTLQTARRGDTLQVLLLGDGLHALPAGSYPELLQFRLVPGDVPDTTRLVLALNALQATTATPEAAPMVLALHPRRLHLTVRPRTAQAILFPDTLRLPATVAGSRQTATAYLSNPGGERTLHARVLPPSDPTLTVAPDSLAVTPDDTARLTITFHPTLRDFGYRVATVRLRHDGVGTDTLLMVEATGVGGLGDATEEGAVDVADLQRGIRFVLALEAPEAQDRLALDVAPFPYGDGRLQLDDLSVLVQAIVRNAWPDGHPLPVPPPTPPAAGKQEAPIVFRPVVKADGRLHLEIDAPQPFGALQLVLPPAFCDTTGTTLPPEARLLAKTTPDRLTLLLYRLDGASFAPGRYRLGVLETERADTLRPVRWVAVDETGRYLPTAVQPAEGTAIASVPGAPVFFPPYPHPFVAGQHTALVLSGELPAPSPFMLEVFDLLGRRLAVEQGQLPGGSFRYRWEVRDAQGHRLAPGLYLLRLRTSSHTRTFPLVVLR